MVAKEAMVRQATERLVEAVEGKIFGSRDNFVEFYILQSLRPTCSPVTNISMSTM
jgi:hypothetical protein